MYVRWGKSDVPYILIESKVDVLLLCLILIAVAFFISDRQNKKNKNSGSSKQGESNDYLIYLRRIFLAANLLALFGDWLQGPYIHRLYSYHGHSEENIAVLFLIGYVSSCVFGSFSGPLADIYGRKFMAMVFCVVYAFCCWTKLYSSFYILLFGRLLGGISTSCLHTSFESWYVAEHNANYFDEGELAITLSLLSLFNSNLAIGAGILSDFLVRDLDLSPISPFLAAIPVLAISCIIIGLFWNENYGDRKMNVIETYTQGLKTIVGDVNILKLGLIQSLVESSMYTFVYLWTPTLTQNQTSYPLGRVFSCFMVAIMIGSFIFRKLVAKMSIESILLLSTALFFASNLLATLICNSGLRDLCLLSFIGIELSLGIYFPAIGTLRGYLVPEKQRSTVVNLFRIPLNILTVLALLIVKSGTTDRQQIFQLTTVELNIAVFLAYTMLPKTTDSATKQIQSDSTVKVL